MAKGDRGSRRGDQISHQQPRLCEPMPYLDVSIYPRIRKREARVQLPTSFLPFVSFFLSGSALTISAVHRPTVSLSCPGTFTTRRPSDVSWHDLRLMTSLSLFLPCILLLCKLQWFDAHLS